MLTMDNLIKSMLDENNKSLKKDIVKKCGAVVSEFITFLSEYWITETKVDCENQCSAQAKNRQFE